jgi:hypothetical protein
MVPQGLSLIEQKSRQTAGVNILGQLIMPKGLSPLEQAVYGSLYRNGNSAPQNVITQDLVQTGVSQGDARQGISGLIKKQVVRKNNLGNEQVLEVVR